MDNIYMQKALQNAKKASKNNEVPVGSIIVENGVILSSGYNQIEKKHSCLEHSEIIAIRKAQKKKKNWRLNDCTIYTTLEPCLMCAGAIVNARIKKVVYAAQSNYLTSKEKKILQQIYKKNNIEVISGILELESKQLLSTFFEFKRNNK